MFLSGDTQPSILLRLNASYNTKGEMESHQNPHDQNFKELLQEFFKEFIELFWPEKSTQIDFSNLKFLQQEVYTDRTPGKGSDKHLDVVAEVQINKEKRHILIHVEHQSTRESHFPKRMFNYFCHLWLIHQKPVFPIALFSDDAKWRKPISNFFEMKTLDKKILHFEFELVKLKELNWKKYLKSENPIAAVLMSKMGYTKSERPRVKAEIVRMFVTGVLREHPKSFFLRNFMEYYLDLNQKEYKIFETHIKSFHFTPENEKMILARVFQEMADEAVAKGMKKGLEQGLEQGIEQGIEQGLEKGKIQGVFEVATKMLEQGLEWSIVRKTTGLTKAKYAQMQKVFAQQ